MQVPERRLYPLYPIRLWRWMLIVTVVLGLICAIVLGLLATSSS